MRIASLDIGTNSFLMLIAQIENSNIIPICDEIAIPQLGTDLTTNDIITEKSLKRGEEALKKFRKIIDNYNVDIVIANATEIFRRAKNSYEIINKLSQRIGAKINIISPEREAYLSFLGAIPDNRLWTVVDIGGGSTEIITGKENEIFYNISLPIGSLILKNQFFQNNIPSEKEILNAKENINVIINKNINEFPQSNFIGIGGTITTLAMIALGMKEFVPQLIDNYIFKYEKNLAQTEQLSKMSAEEIATQFNIHSKRAEILFAGALIFLLIQEKFGKSDFYISSKGLRYGAIKDFLIENSQIC
ncbi:MAG TPA: hypothetical protein PKV40_02195 [Candidatus Kapabacteria bacterium]|nr:hypothetical protein [Candidatus Kapabacteria bacterium]